MNAVPAKVAGVERARHGHADAGRNDHPLVLVAQALPVRDLSRRRRPARSQPLPTARDRSSRWAKSSARQCLCRSGEAAGFGLVGIDMIAGPSEVLVVADRDNDAWIAADLLAQAEHDSAAQAILITDDDALARCCRGPVERALETLPRPRLLRECDNFGAVIRDCAAGRRDRRSSTALLRNIWSLASRSRRRFPRESAMPARSLLGAYAGSDRRLCRRIQPRVCRRRARHDFLRVLRPRLHEAHVRSEMR